MSFSTAIPTELLPHKSIVVCSTGRSGSTLLCRTLSSLNCVGHLEEFFVDERLARNNIGPSASELYPYLAEVYRAGTTPNGVFGIKLHWDHLKTLTNTARTDPELRSKSNLEILTLLFPNPYFVFIRRGNVTQQAISAAISYQTNVYTIPKDFRGNPSRKKQTPAFNPLNIYRYKQGLKARNQNWLLFFQKNNLPFFEVVYEEFIDTFVVTIQQILEFVEVEPPDPDIEIAAATRKVGDGLNERWYQYYKLIPESWLALYSTLRSRLREMIFSR